jgi:hypothetical protein
MWSGQRQMKNWPTGSHIRWRFFVSGLLGKCCGARSHCTAFLRQRARLMATIGSCAALVPIACPSAASANLPSETDGLIAYQRNDDARGEIWLLDPAASAPESAATKLTVDGVAEARPAWGPKFHTDGGADVPQHLAFQRLQDGQWDIWDRSPVTGAAAPLVTGPGNQVEPVYSDAITPITGTPATGQALLAYVGDQSGSRELWLKDGSGASTQLTLDGGGYANPDFSGKFRVLGPTEDVDLLFESTRGGARAIWAVTLTVYWATGALVGHTDPRLVATGPQELTEPSAQATHDSAGTPADHVADVLFTTREVGTTFLDYVEEELGSAPPFTGASPVTRYQLTGDPGGDTDGAWAPRGDRIVFVRTLDGNPDLWIMSSSGTNLQRFTQRAGSDLAPSWQPGQESSADLVGGHTYPGPVTRTPKTNPPVNSTPPTNPRPPHPNPPHLRWPKLAIRTAKWHARRITVTGSTARGFHRRVRVAFACGHRHRQHVQRRVRARSGRLGAKLRAPRACRHARRGVVAAAYGGDGRYRAQKVSVRVHRR